MRIAKWFAMLADRLPRKLAKHLRESNADDDVSPEARREAAPARLAATNWLLPPDRKFDRDEANERQ